MKMKSYDWLRDVLYDYNGLIVYTTIDIYDYEEKLGIKRYYYWDEYGDGSSIEYFMVTNTMVTIYNHDVFFVQSEEDEVIIKVLEYIDKAVS